MSLLEPCKGAGWEGGGGRRGKTPDTTPGMDVPRSALRLWRTVQSAGYAIRIPGRAECVRIGAGLESQQGMAPPLLPETLGLRGKQETISAASELSSPGMSLAVEIEGRSRGCTPQGMGYSELWLRGISPVRAGDFRDDARGPAESGWVVARSSRARPISRGRAA